MTHPRRNFQTAAITAEEYWTWRLTRPLTDPPTDHEAARERAAHAATPDGEPGAAIVGTNQEKNR